MLNGDGVDLRNTSQSMDDCTSQGVFGGDDGMGKMLAAEVEEASLEWPQFDK
ncbi:hypothetical protein LINPERHAP1_LOCUS6112 [Linum perenne]